MSKKYASVEEKHCAACGVCTKVCPRGAIAIKNGCVAVVNEQECAGCGLCGKACPAGAIKGKVIDE